MVWDSGREETTLVPSHSTLHINVTPGHIPANTVAEVFRRILEEQLSSEEMREVVIVWTVAKEEEGTERVVRWETLVPPELAPPVGGCLVRMDLRDSQNTVLGDRASSCGSGRRRTMKKKTKKEEEGAWVRQRPCGKVPLTGYRQALPRGREKKHQRERKKVERKHNEKERN